MRITILFLIFINVAFLYWAKQQDFNQVIAAESGIVSGYAPIELLTERKPIQTSVQASKKTQLSSLRSTNEKLDRTLECFSVGPFDRNELSDEVYEILLDSGIDAKQRSVRERQPKSYWVYLPPYESLAEANATVAFLENNNINEYYVMPEPPEHLHAISLGLFEKLSAARNKVAEIKKLKLDPKMEVRFNEFTQYWIDFRQYNDSPQPKVLEELLKENDRMLVLEAKCI